MSRETASSTGPGADAPKPRKRRLVVRLLLIVLVVGAGYACWPRTADLRRFDPAVAAGLETGMWRSYYEKRPVALVTGLYRMAREQYGFSPLDSVRIAWHASRAALAFQPTQSRAAAEVAIPNLVSYFEILARGAPVAFDTAAAAREELDWWQRRREHETWQQYADPVARVTALLYGVKPERVLEFARLRCAAMDDRDRHGERIQDADWQRIEATLRQAWAALRRAVGG